MSQFVAMSPAPSLRADAFAGVRTRRMVAACFDFVLVSVLVALFWTTSVVLTLGFALFVLPPLWPIVAFFYNGLTVSGQRMATPGMRLMDLEMRTHDSGQRVPFVNAAVQAVLFYVSWFFPPIFLVSLVDSEKRCLHDILSGVVVVRRM
ncbi:putative RDD family membrane protein YckC [Roseiarcus fermentans]|uniref:Putative RDD family membrane protein YckC n=1 Tax=Roseiarcus fermentans TaxID=1473586 RepID=A0A366F1W8_9HYPH|nr:RDD family protein [Roseiarcus fermentans]RBP08587.1 putative RDD family membrane protein YckC [Roseiarcus fermentans]